MLIAKTCEVAETPIPVVMTVLQVIRIEQVYYQDRRKEEISWQATKSELD